MESDCRIYKSIFTLNRMSGIAAEIHNVPGMFYVTLDCLACEACQYVAPNHFRYSEFGLSYVFKQPTTSEEVKKCREAMDDCPMEAIKDDGA